MKKGRYCLTMIVEVPGNWNAHDTIAEQLGMTWPEIEMGAELPRQVLSANCTNVRNPADRANAYRLKKQEEPNAAV
jgi:hypothetical protein